MIDLVSALTLPTDGPACTARYTRYPIDFGLAEKRFLFRTSQDTHRRDQAIL